MFCPNCGSEFSTDDSFCTECGCRLKQTASVFRESPSAGSTDSATVASIEQSETKKRAILAVVIVSVVAIICVGAFMVFKSGDARGTWYQSNNYYSYDAVMQLDSSSYVITADTGGEWSGEASVDGDSIEIGGYTYELQDGGQKLVCVSNKGTNVFAGEWYRSESAAAAHPRRQ